MIPNKFQNIFNKKSIRLLVVVSCILIMFILYFSAILSAQNSALQWVKSDMQKKLETFLLSTDAEFNKSTWYAASLVGNNSLRMPLSLGIYTQVKEFLNEAEGVSKGDSKIIVVNAENKEVYNNTGYFKDLSKLDMGNSQYSAYASEGSILRVSYFPMFSEYVSKTASVRTHLGAVISVYNFLDFFNQLQKSDRDDGYVYYGFAQNKLQFIVDGSHKAVNSTISSTSLKKFKEGFIHLNIDGRNTLMLMKYIPLMKSDKPFILSIAIPPAKYRQLENVYLLGSLRNTSVVAILITAIMFFVYFTFKKNLTNLLEIQNLRTQRHDFSKHIDVIRGMAVLDEFSELKAYAEALGERISLTGELSNLGCRSLSILLEEKEADAVEKDIDFRVYVKTAIHDIHVKAYDLCVIMGNIIDNAIESCTAIQDSVPRVFIEIGADSRFYYFMISNTGKSIPEKDIEKIFRPGFSTKPQRKSRGMGLYIVSKTLKKYRGSIKVDSLEGMTVFTVYIPRKN